MTTPSSKKKTVKAFAIISKSKPLGLLYDKYIGRILVYKTEKFARHQAGLAIEAVIPVTITFSPPKPHGK